MTEAARAARVCTTQGDFTVSLVSGHDFPKEIVIEVGYNFSSSVAAGPALLPSA